MSLETLVNVTITTQTKSVSRAGFGTPLIASYNAVTAGARVRTYGDLTEMVTAGYLVTDKEYLAAAAFVAQNPKVATWKVGRMDLAPTQVKRFTPDPVAGLQVGLVHTVVVESNDGTLTTVSYTVLGGDVIADVTLALQTALNAIAGITAVDGGTFVTVTADTAGELFGFTELNAELAMLDQTADPGVATDLAAILAEDPDWYGLILTNKSEAIINASAAWVETAKKFHIAQTSDSQVKDAVVITDILSDLQAAAYARTGGMYHEDDRAFADAAWMGVQFPKTPGSTTWAFKTLAGITVSNLTTGATAAIEGKSGNHYTPVAGVNITFEGKSGSGEFFDITRFVDALTAGLREDVFATLVNNEKIPYTDGGVNIMVGVVKGRLTQGILAGGLAADPAPVVTVPKVADIPDADKIARRLPDLDFTATLAGAIHKLVISGTISV